MRRLAMKHLFFLCILLLLSSCLEFVGNINVDADADIDIEGNINIDAEANVNVEVDIDIGTNTEEDDVDTDSDGINNSLDDDDDNDGLLDIVETATGIWVDENDTGTDPFLADTDGDGLIDSVETNTGIFVDLNNTGTNPLLEDTDADGIYDYEDLTLLPTISVTSYPSTTTTETSATFEFSTPDIGAFFYCSIDGNEESLCLSPHVISNISESAHNFKISIVDEAGSTVNNAFDFDWTVADPPETKILLESAIKPVITLGSGALSVWGTSPSDIWTGSKLESKIFHFDGSNWDGGTTLTYDINVNVEAIFGFSANDVWAGASKIYKFDGSTWEETTTLKSGIRSIWGTSSNNLWVATGGGYLEHYDGSDWDEPISVTSEIPSILTGTGANDVWYGGNGFLFHFEGDSWQEFTPFSFSSDKTPSSLVLLDDNKLWMSSSSQIYYFDGTEWDLKYQHSGSAAGIWSLSNGDIYSLHRNGDICRMKNETWRCNVFNNLPSDINFLRTWSYKIQDENHVWAAGDSVYHYTDIPLYQTTTQNTAYFSFQIDETGTTECQLDAGNWDNCENDVLYTSLSDGEHTFCVKGTDVAGNEDLSPACFTWTISS